jgi:hypothetical protein
MVTKRQPSLEANCLNMSLDRHRPPMLRAAVALTLLLGLLTWAAVQLPRDARSAAAAECSGDYRWNIKTLSDPDAGTVRLTPVKAGVADLYDLAKPPGFKSKLRNPPFETTTYKIRAKLVRARWVNEAPSASKKGGDLDIHLVIAALTNPDKTMIVEFPFADCIDAVPALKQKMVDARAAFAARCKDGEPRRKFHNLSGIATVTGVGFYDRPHAIGSALHGVELHPVIKFSSSSCRWLD